MLAQRAPVPPAMTSRPVTAAKPRPTSRPRKMTFMDRHMLATLPARIASLEAELLRLNTALADPDLYRRNPTQFDTLTKALAVAQHSLANAEEQWLSLEMLREELEG
jgi:ATP-binding cassette subfamily F protein uup